MTGSVESQRAADQAECKGEPGRVVPVVDRNRCEAKAACVDVCPFDVFEMRPLEAVDAAAQSKSPSLVICRYCGALVAPEFSLGEELCMGCGSSVFGVVY